jgi:hypothetical protein
MVEPLLANHRRLVALVMIDGQYGYVETQPLSLRKEVMAQASGKEQSRRERRGVALLQNPAHRPDEFQQTCL